ncbi:hypothetical protein IW262DRAFT_1393660 [Armillaria fumosa]|nr:hypothetical protein IW262DRAFT_1393660 [Armillaria fumosa]
MEHTPYTLFPGNLASSRSVSLTPPAIRGPNAGTPLPSFATVQPYRIPSRRPRNAFIIFRDVFLAANKNILPRQQTKVSTIAGAIWRGLSEEQQLIYQTLARLEREVYEHDNPAPASQRRVSSGSRNSRGRRGIPVQSVDDLLHGPIALDLDPQVFLYRAPSIAPTAAYEISRAQYPTFSMMNGTTDAVLHDVHTTQGQIRHGQATQGTQTSRQSSASASIQATLAETSVTDSQFHNPVSYYRDTSGQSFAVMNQAVIPQYLPSTPIAAPIAHRPDPVATSFIHHQLNRNTHNQGWGEPSTIHTSASSSVEVGSFNYGGGSTHGEGSSAYYGHPAENTWDGFQDHQRQPWSSGHSGQSS